MSPGFKYHIVSISAIFFALTIGLVVGSVFVSPQVANRQDINIKRLQQTLNSDVEKQRHELANYKEYATKIAPLALRGRLGPTSVAVIQTGDYPDDAARAGEAVAMAEPRSIEHIIITPSLDRETADLNTALAGLHTGDPLVPGDRDGLYQAFAAALAHGDSVASPLLPRLDHEGLIRLGGEDNYGLAVKMAVVVVGSRAIDSVRTSRVDIPLIRALLKQGISVVVCEGREAAASDLPALRIFQGDISTIDNIDTDFGAAALVLASAGPHDNYGEKPGTTHLLPETAAP